MYTSPMLTVQGHLCTSVHGIQTPRESPPRQYALDNAPTNSMIDDISFVSILACCILPDHAVGERLLGGGGDTGGGRGGGHCQGPPKC